MLNTYIKNRGITKTIIQNGNKNEVSETNWNVDYDGNTADISVDTESNGDHQIFHTKLNNSDLADLLNFPSVDMPIHKRLERDFYVPQDNLLVPLYIKKKRHSTRRKHRKHRKSTRRHHKSYRL